MSGKYLCNRHKLKHHYTQIPSRQTQYICITFVQRRANAFDVGPTLYKCYTNVLCLLGWCLHTTHPCRPRRLGSGSRHLCPGSGRACSPALPTQARLHPSNITSTVYSIKNLTMFDRVQIIRKYSYLSKWHIHTCGV